MAIRRFSAADVRQVRRVRPHQYPIERLKLKVKTLRQSVSCLDWKCLLHELERQIQSATPKNKQIQVGARNFELAIIGTNSAPEKIWYPKRKCFQTITF